MGFRNFNLIFGWLEKRKVHARFRFEQGDIHKEFFFYVYEFFHEYCQSSPKLRERYDNRTIKIYYTWHFSTKSYPVFTEIYDIFYKDRKKIVPENIVDLISPISLAFWITPNLIQLLNLFIIGIIALVLSGNPSDSVCLIYA